MSTLPHRISGSGPAVVLIHGTAPDFFDALEAELQRDHTVVRLDRRGFGASSLPAVGKLTPHAEDIAAIVDTLGGATLVGWSIGGVIALETALLREHAVRGLVLLEPPWLAKSSPTLRMLAAILGAKTRGAFGAAGAGGERFLRWALNRRDGRCELDVLSGADRARVQQCGAAILRELDGGTGEHVAPRLTSPLRMPVELLFGTDSTPEFEAAAARLGQQLGITPRAIEGAGHMLQETHAVLVAEAVRAVTRVAAA
jgi:pimeloyl-ACP methyl ester carboxylesterase